MFVADGQLPVVDALHVCIDNLPKVGKSSCIVVSIFGCKVGLAVGPDEESVDDEECCIEEAMVGKQEVSCDVAVPEVMPIETSLPSVEQTRFDGTSQQLSGFDDHMLDSALLEDQVVAQLVGRAP